MSSKECEKLPFLGTDSDDVDSTAFADLGKRRSRLTPLRWHLLFGLFHVAFLCANISLLLWNTSRTDFRANGGDVVPGETFPPTPSSLGYKVEAIGHHDGSASPYIGEPRLELDQAWSSLMRTTALTFSADEMREMNRTSVALRDGGRYLGYLEVTHMIHCVKRMYQFRHRDYYTDVPDSKFELHHWEHCVEVLLQGVMCNADLYINMYEWESPDKIKEVKGSPRKCVDWTRLQNWANDRFVPVDTSLYEHLLPGVGP